MVVRLYLKKVRRSALASKIHSPLYEIEYIWIARKALEVIDPLVGKGRSNLCEGKWYVLTKFRLVQTNLYKLPYEVSTKMDLCQSNMTWLIKCKVSTCHQVLFELQSNLAISNSVNSKSPLFRRKIECPWIYPSPLCFPGYFKAPLFRTFFHFPWDFEIAGFNCNRITCSSWH